MTKGISLHIGLNFVDPAHYSGWDGELIACEFDAKDMSVIAKLNKFSGVTLLREKATRAAVIGQIESAAKSLVSGDIFMITYSGHGGQVPDNNADEDDDALDETWCLFDGELLDDELYALWAKFQSGVRILIITDSCHNETIAKAITDRQDKWRNFKSRAMPHEIASSTYFNNKDFYDNIQSGLKALKPSDIPPTVKTISGCMDNQESKDGAFNGRFTGILKAVWNGGKFSGNYHAFHKQILNRFTPFPDQSPALNTIGGVNSVFDNQSPFTI